MLRFIDFQYVGREIIFIVEECADKFGVKEFSFLFSGRCPRGWLANWPPVGQQGSFWR